MSKTILSDRCMGECCKDIGLSISPDELKQSYFNFINKLQGMTHVINSSECDRRLNIFEDIYLAYPMLRFVKEDYIHPEAPKEKSNQKIYHYTCVHFNDKEKKCDIYDIRPKMCSIYPNKSWCGNPKCKWDKMVEGREKHLIEKKKYEEEMKKEKNAGNIKYKISESPAEISEDHKSEIKTRLKMKLKGVTSDK